MNLTPFIIPAIVVILLIIIIACGYIKAAPNEARVISGLKKKNRYLIGRAGVRIPFLERVDKLTLKLIPIDIKTSAAVPTADYININVDAAVNIQIGNDDKMLELASKNFLNKKDLEIAAIAKEVLEGNMREIVGKMRLEEMVSDRIKFAELVRENADPDLAAMGLKIISFNVQNFTDNDDVITNLGVDNIVSIRKRAAISRAESERDIHIAQAAADKESNDARVEADINIATKNNELALKQADLKVIEDQARAKADAAYKIQEEEQRKTIEVATANANIAKQQKEAELQKEIAIVREEALNAEVRKQAEADKYKVEQEAEAEANKRKREAEAEAYKVQKEAEAEKSRAEAARYAKEQEAAGISAMGKAEAEAIKAKGEAEAEAMSRRADAYAKYNGAAVTQLIIDKLPEIAHEVAAPISAIDKITIIDSGNGKSGVDVVGGYTPAILSKTIEAVKETTGVDLTEVMRAGTYDAKVNKNINLNGLGDLKVDGNNFCKDCDGTNGDCQCVPQPAPENFMNPPIEN